MRSGTFLHQTTRIVEQVQAFLAGIGSALGLAPGVFGSIIGAVIVLVVGYLLAKALSGLVRRGIDATGVQARIDRGRRGSVHIPRLVGKLVYYLLMVIVLIIVLDILGIERALAPLENLVDNFFAFLPRLIGAAAIAFAGYVIAKLVSELVGLAVGGVEGLTERYGLADTVDWANLARQVVFLVVFIPLLIAAIDVLGLATISAPLTEILRDFLDAIPRIIGAGLVLAVFYYLAKFISGFVRNLLVGVDVDGFARRVGLAVLIGNTTSIAQVASGVVFFFVVFSGLVTAVNILGFDDLTVLLNEMFEITLQIIFGLVVLAVGSVVAGLAYRAVRSSQNSEFLASIARYAVLALFVAIALRTMGIADDIINLAFGLTLGALAVAFALSFGLGGREAAGKQMEAFLSRFREEAGGSASTTPTRPLPPSGPPASSPS